MKKNLSLILLLLLIAFVSCKKESVNEPISGVKFTWVSEPDSIQKQYGIKDDGIFVGINDSRITTTVQTPIYAKQSSITFSSGNNSIVSIAVDGTITGKSQGSTYIYASGINSLKETIKDSCKVYVDTIPVRTVTVSINAASFNDYNVQGNTKTSDGTKDSTFSVINKDTLFRNDWAVMSVTYTPLEASFPEIEWTTSDSNIFEIKGDSIHAIADGEATISGTLKSKQKGYESLKIEKEWKVRPQKISAIMFTAPSKKIVTRTNTKADLLFSPTFATDKSVRFVSSDPELLDVKNGYIYAYGDPGKEVFLYVFSKAPDDMKVPGKLLDTDTIKTKFKIVAK